MTVFTPAFVSEFPDHPVTDCVPSSGLMLVNKITHNKYPASITEREALQNAMGTQDEGANATQLCDGIKKRYGISLQPTFSSPGELAALKMPREGVVMLGSYQKLPAYIRSQGLQPSFDGLHCMYAQADGNGMVTVGDPLADHFYRGIPISDLQAYTASFPQGVIAAEQVTLSGYRAYIGPGKVSLFKYWPGTLIRRATKIVEFTRSGGSPAAVKHGAKGHWMLSAGDLLGWYCEYPATTPFRIVAIYSDGSVRSVSSAS